MEKLNYNQATFLLSAATLEQLPADEGAEVAFIGRSNAGKSSALNTITGIKGLARISKMPGRTQLINLFALDDDHRFVDLPGYGYAKVPLSVKKRWEETVNHYLQQRHCLRGLVLVMDIRHPLKRLDLQLIEWAAKCDLPVHILLTKVDKLKSTPALHTLHKVQQAVSPFTQTSVQCFSSLTQAGLEEALAQLNSWLTEDSLHAAE